MALYTALSLQNFSVSDINQSRLASLETKESIRPEVFLYSSDFGHTVQITPVSEIDPDLPNWLINMDNLRSSSDST